MAVYDVQCNALTGGASGALDYVDGNLLSDGSKALVQTNGVAYLYRLNASSGAAESSPGVISPDSNAGNKRWILQGVYLATAQLANGTSINEFSTDGTLAGDSDDAVPTEKAVKTYVDSVGGMTVGTFSGYVERPMFEYKDTDEIYINPGRHHHDGTSEQLLYWDSKLTFQFGPGGSNAGSSALSASAWFYLYADDSAIVTAGTSLLTASEFIATTTAPTYSVTKHGLYNGNDKLVGVFRTNASSQILEFWHDGGDLLQYAASFEDRAASDLDTTFEDVVLTLPDLGDLTAGLVAIRVRGAEQAADLLYRKNGSSSGGIRVCGVHPGSGDYETNSSVLKVFTDDAQTIEIKLSVAGGSTARVDTLGYYFPRGM